MIISNNQNAKAINLNDMIQGSTWQTNLIIWLVGVVAGGINYSVQLVITPDWIKFFHATMSAAFFGIIAVIAKQLYLFVFKKIVRPYTINVWVSLTKKFHKEPTITITTDQTKTKTEIAVPKTDETKKS